MYSFNTISLLRQAVLPLHVGLLLISLIVSGCGKKAKQQTNVIREEETYTPSEMEEQLKRQSVSCDNGISCPASIAKIVVIDRGRLKTCTGFLVNSVTVATAASCLTERLRVSSSEQLCRSDVHIFFPRSDFQAAKRVHCARFLLVTPLEGTNPVLWRNDLAYIELDKPVSRRFLRITRDGIKDGDTMTMWKVDQENDQVGIIRKSECQAVLQSYANPLSTSSFDPSYLISNCSLKTGNRGAPILDSKGKWQGIYSGPLNSEVMSFLNTSRRLVEPLMSIGHVSNTVCLPALIDSDPVTKKECFRDLDTTQLDLSRAALLGNPTSHENARVLIGEEASNKKPYINWDAELVPSTDMQGSFDVRLTPKCLKPVRNWIRIFRNPPSKLTYSMTLPDWKLSVGFDRAAHIVTRLDTSGKQTVNVEFSPSSARSGRSSYVKVWTGNNTQNYRSVTESCE